MYTNVAYKLTIFSSWMGTSMLVRTSKIFPSKIWRCTKNQVIYPPLAIQTPILKPGINVVVEKSECGQPEIPAHGDAFVFFNEEMGYEQANYSCHEGFQLEGPEQRICEGDWGEEQTICINSDIEGPRGLGRAFDSA